MKLQAVQTTCIGTIHPCQYIIKCKDEKVPCLYLRYRGGRFVAAKMTDDEHIDKILIDERRVSGIGGNDVAPLFEMLHWLKANGIEVIQ